jgi:septal ring factor EnvC (AmiA/AmiB activator)
MTVMDFLLSFLRTISMSLPKGLQAKVQAAITQIKTIRAKLAEVLASNLKLTEKNAELTNQLLEAQNALVAANSTAAINAQAAAEAQAKAEELQQSIAPLQAQIAEAQQAIAAHEAEEVEEEEEAAELGSEIDAAIAEQPPVVAE